ncbi:hypothetical protein PGT21_002982 [Puccinia graminis f. sp. tritici]|uniref:Uncharacterized protein n=1 Tax=Puccinia graminis f. sp. tritici TaxID=56615 RepID=A0A5B0NK70_PUCGR|nr:hypothetical protein PGT21_002982 [Puccinia graminis f. sp. tritici]
MIVSEYTNVRSPEAPSGFLPLHLVRLPPTQPGDEDNEFLATRYFHNAALEKGELPAFRQQIRKQHED